jgi:hypothetical protein
MFTLTGEEKDLNVKDLVKEIHGHRFNFDDPLPERPEYLIWYEDEQGEEYGIALPGSIIQVSGQSKTRKSTFLATVAAATLNQDGAALNIRSSIKRNVLYFDTEQSEYEFKRFQNMVCRMAGVRHHPPQYFGYPLRKYDEETRLVAIDAFLTQMKPDFLEKIGLIIIDGIADCLTSTNDLAESKKLVTRLTYWADELKVPIFVAIHTNKDGENSTGMLGGFLDKKCSYHVRTANVSEARDSPTRVSCKFSRLGESFPAFTFKHDDSSGLPVLTSLSEISLDFMDNTSKLPAEPVIKSLKF